MVNLGLLLLLLLGPDLILGIHLVLLLYLQLKFLLVVVNISGSLIIIVTASLQRLLLYFLLLLSLAGHLVVLLLLVKVRLDLVLRCVDVVVGLYLHILEHLLIILVIHRELICKLLFTEFFTYDSLMLLFVIGTFVSLVVTSLSRLTVLLALKLSLLHSMVSSAIDLLLAVLPLVLRQIYLFSPVIKSVVLYYLSNDFPDIIFIGQLFQESGNPVKLGISHIIVPTNTWDCIFGLEHEGNGRVINNNNIGHVPTQSGKIFYESIVVERTVFSIELISTFFVRIQNVAEWCCIFGKTRCENDHFIEFAHPL